MKKMLELKCKNCAANLNIAENQRLFICEYCGSQLERELSYEERRRMNAQETAEKVMQYKENLEEWYGLQTNRKKLEERIRENSIMIPIGYFVQNPNVLVKLLIIVSLVCSVCAIFTNIFFLYLGLTLLLLAGMSYIVLKIWQREAIYINEQKRIDCEKEKTYLENIYKKLQELEEKFDINYIPKKYRREELLNIIYALLVSESADNLQSAIQQCEMEIQRREILKLQEQQQKEMEELKAMKKNLEWERSQAYTQKYKQKKEDSESSIVKVGTAIVGAVILKKITKGIFK